MLWSHVLEGLEGGKVCEKVGFLSEKLGGKFAEEGDSLAAEVVGGVGVLGDDAGVGVLEGSEQIALRQDAALSTLPHARSAAKMNNI